MFRDFKKEKKGQASILPMLLVVGILVTLLGVGYLAYRDIMGVGAGVFLTGIGGVGAGGTTDASSFTVSLYDPITNEDVDGTITLFKDGIRIGQSDTTSGSVSITNLDPSQTYTMEITPDDTTWFYPFKATATTNPTGPKQVGLPVDPMHNTAIEFSVFNNDNRTANSTSARQAFAASDKQSIYVQMRVPSTTNDNNYLGDGMKGLYFQFDLNGDAFQSVEAVDDAGAMDCSTYSKLSGHSNIDTNRTGNLACVSRLTQVKANTDYDLKFTWTSTSLDPVNSMTDDTNGSIWATVYDSCRILNTNTGQYEEQWRNPVTLGDICVTTTSHFAIEYE